MRTIERTTKFKKDYKRELKGRHKASLQVELIKALQALVKGDVLENRYFDHGKKGSALEWRIIIW